jgi:hypothetical protein
VPTVSDYLTLSQAAYTTGGEPPSAPPGWTVMLYQTDTNGMQAVAFQNASTGEIIIAYEGTRPCGQT